MKETFIATLSPMLVMFLCILIGYLLKKKNLAPDNTATVLSKLENWVFVPALIINTFSKYCNYKSICDNYSLIIYSAIALFFALLISIPLSKAFVKEGYNRNVYKYALAFGNFSFMGNAIVPAIMGEEALYSYMLYTLPLNVAVYTWGLVILIPKGEQKSIIKNLINPIFVSIIIGAIIGLSGASNIMPKFISTTISNCASCMGCVAMLLTGFVVASYNFKELIIKKQVYIATFLRLFVLPALFISILYFMGASKLVLILTMFAFATPLGLNTVVFAAAYGGDTKTGASMALISHTLCVITIPIVYAVINYIF